jgi:adenylyltransferase/sulfurtransferase
MQQLNKEEFKRYSRHILIPDIGIQGQIKLKESKVLIVGAGGLGVPVLIYLAAAGVGEIGIVDFDTIDISNLQRQVIYKTSDVGKLKVEMANKFVKEQNPETNITIYRSAINAENAIEIIAPYDIIVDGTDNFPTRYLLNDACVLSHKVYIYGSIYRFEGQVSVFNLPKTENRGPNYRDLFPHPPHPDLVPNCSEGGVIGVLPGIVGSLQALETIKVITGVGEPLSGKLLTLDTLDNQYRTFKFKKRKDNPLTGENPSIHELIDYEAFCNPGAHNEEKIEEIDVFELQRWKIERREFQLIDVREKDEYELSNIGGELMPKSEIEKYIPQIRKDIPVIVQCRSGKRSAQVIRVLNKDSGDYDLYNLKGGILAYAEEINSQLIVY